MIKILQSSAFRMFVQHIIVKSHGGGNSICYLFIYPVSHDLCVACWEQICYNWDVLRDTPVIKREANNYPSRGTQFDSFSIKTHV
jgi:hypothetical protein